MADPAGSIPDVGRDGPTGPEGSVPTTLVVRSSGAMDVCDLSDGGLARPTYSSALLDESVLRPSVFVNARNTSESSFARETNETIWHIYRNK